MADPIDELYSLPLEEFTQARNELAKRLGDPTVRQLKKPSISAWAVNQLARQREVDMRRLLRAGERLEQAQKGVFAGGDQRAFTDAQREQRDAIRRLRSEAAELLRAGGHPAADATLERLATTLQAAAGTEDGRERLRTGRLTEDLEPLGFGVFAGVTPTPSARRSKAKPQAPPPPRPNKQLEKARADLKSARDEAETAEKAAREAERIADQARRAAERAAQRVSRLEARVHELSS